MAEEGGRSRSTCSGIPGIRSHAVAELPGLIEKLLLNEAAGRHTVCFIPYAAMSETSSNCWKFSVIYEASCWEYLVDKPSRTSWMAA